MKAADISLISYLDLISCSFGAAVLLFLIMTTAPTESGSQGRSIVVVRCLHQQGPRAEVDIEFRRPGATDWQSSRKQVKGIEGFAAVSEPASGAEAFVILLSPESGRWEFRPLLIDFPRDASRKPIEMVLEVFGERARVEEPLAEVKPLTLPGESGQVLRVFIRSEGQ